MLTLKRRFTDSQMVTITNFVVVSSVGIKRVVCTFGHVRPTKTKLRLRMHYTCANVFPDIKKVSISNCVSTQFDQGLRYPHEEILHYWLFKMHPVKIQIRLRICAGCSESSLGVRVRWYAF